MLELPLWDKGCPLVKMPWRLIQRRRSRWGARRRSIHFPLKKTWTFEHRTYLLLFIIKESHKTASNQPRSNIPIKNVIRARKPSLLTPRSTRKERSALYARPLSPDIAEVPLLSGFKVELNRRPRTLAFKNPFYAPSL